MFRATSRWHANGSAPGISLRTRGVREYRYRTLSARRKHEVQRSITRAEQDSPIVQFLWRNYQHGYNRGRVRSDGTVKSATTQVSVVTGEAPGYHAPWVANGMPYSSSRKQEKKMREDNLGAVKQDDIDEGVTDSSSENMSGFVLNNFFSSAAEYEAQRNRVVTRRKLRHSEAWRRSIQEAASASVSKSGEPEASRSRIHDSDSKGSLTKKKATIVSLKFKSPFTKPTHLSTAAGRWWVLPEALPETPAEIINQQGTADIYDPPFDATVTSHFSAERGTESDEHKDIKDHRKVDQDDENAGVFEDAAAAVQAMTTASQRMDVLFVLSLPPRELCRLLGHGAEVGLGQASPATRTALVGAFADHVHGFTTTAEIAAAVRGIVNIGLQKRAGTSPLSSSSTRSANHPPDSSAPAGNNGSHSPVLAVASHVARVVSTPIGAQKLSERVLKEGRLFWNAARRRHALAGRSKTDAASTPTTPAASSYEPREQGEPPSAQQSFRHNHAACAGVTFLHSSLLYCGGDVFRLFNVGEPESVPASTSLPPRSRSRSREGRPPPSECFRFPSSPVPEAPRSHQPYVVLRHSVGLTTSGVFDLLSISEVRSRVLVSSPTSASVVGGVPSVMMTEVRAKCFTAALQLLDVVALTVEPMLVDTTARLDAVLHEVSLMVQSFSSEDSESDRSATTNRDENATNRSSTKSGSETQSTDKAHLNRQPQQRLQKRATRSAVRKDPNVDAVLSNVMDEQSQRRVLESFDLVLAVLEKVGCEAKGGDFFATSSSTFSENGNKTSQPRDDVVMRDEEIGVFAMAALASANPISQALQRLTATATTLLTRIEELSDCYTRAVHQSVASAEASSIVPLKNDDSSVALRQQRHHRTAMVMPSLFAGHTRSNRGQSRAVQRRGGTPNNGSTSPDGSSSNDNRSGDQRTEATQSAGGEEPIGVAYGHDARQSQGVSDSSLLVMPPSTQHRVVCDGIHAGRTMTFVDALMTNASAIVRQCDTEIAAAALRHPPTELPPVVSRFSAVSLRSLAAVGAEAPTESSQRATYPRLQALATAMKAVVP